MSNSRNSKLMDSLLTPALAGVIAAAGSYILLDEKGSYPVFGMLVPSFVGIGGTVFAASLAGNVIGTWALPRIPGNMRFANMEKMLVMPVATGAASFALIKFTNDISSQVSFPYAFGIGFASEIAAQYSTDIVKPYVNKDSRY